MIVTEYEGSDRLKFECDRCGFLAYRWNVSTMEMFAVRCKCKPLSEHPGDSEQPSDPARAEQKDQ